MSEPIDFQPFCQNCPKGDTHCCTQKGNVVLILDEEKKLLQEKYNELLKSKKIKHKNLNLFNESEKKGKFTPLNNISDVIADSNGEPVNVDLCPFFGLEQNKCLIHSTKPMDCKVWPIVKFEDPNVHIDSKCSAINSKTPIPRETVQTYIDTIDEVLSEEDKTVYFDLTRPTYDLEPIPLEHWDTFQQIKEVSNIENNIQSVKSSVNKFKNRYRKKYYNPEVVLRVTKWVIAVFFGLIMASFVNQITYNVSVIDFETKQYFINELTQNKTEVWLHIVLLVFFSSIFILDIYRIIIPLPWVLKRYKKDLEGGNKFDLPVGVPLYQLIKLVSIGTLSFLLLNVMAIRFVIEPLHYLALYGVLLILDSVWYIFNSKRIESSFHWLKVLAPLIITYTLSISIIGHYHTISTLSNRSILFIGIAAIVILIFYIIMYQRVNRDSKSKSYGIDKFFSYLKRHNRLKEFEILKAEIEDFKENKYIENDILPFIEKMNKEQKDLAFASDNTNFAITYLQKQIENNKKKFKEQKEGLKKENEYLEYFDDLEKKVSEESFIWFVLADGIICVFTPLLIFFNNNVFEYDNWICNNYILIMTIALFLHVVVASWELIWNKWYVGYIEYLYLKPIKHSNRND